MNKGDCGFVERNRSDVESQSNLEGIASCWTGDNALDTGCFIGLLVDCFQQTFDIINVSDLFLSLDDQVEELGESVGASMHNHECMEMEGKTEDNFE